MNPHEARGKGAGVSGEPGEHRPGALTAMGSFSPRGGRMMRAGVLTALRKAGKRGLTTSELARKLGVLKSRVQVWLSSTGKSVEGLEKLAPGHWRYQPPPEQQSAAQGVEK